jgi:ubiquinone/menaquinone biosynthesis C-methylase UbiE
MACEKRDFDREAASWDEEPGRLNLAADIAGAIADEVPLTADMDILDFGCGTGLVALQLLPFVRSVLGVDGSRGMLEVLNRKIAQKNLAHIETRYFDLDGGDVLDGSYDLVISSMTFHHIRELRILLEQCYRVIRPSGYLCVADLDPDAGLFHGDPSGVFHEGFDRAVLRKGFNEAGFGQIRDRTASVVKKPLHDGTEGEFTVFIMTGRKSM